MNNVQIEKQTPQKNKQRIENLQKNSLANVQARNQNSENQFRENGSAPKKGVGNNARPLIPIAALSAVVTSQMVDHLAPRIFKDIKGYLDAQFGEEKVESWLTFFNGEHVGDENAVYTMLREAAPSLPEEFSLSNLMDWKPIKARVTQSPVAAAAAVAAGVGTLYIAREFLKNGKVPFASASELAEKTKAKLAGSRAKTSKKSAPKKPTRSKKTTRARA
jgi:hypothetical protein